jgi:hypothetical protein
MSAQFVRATNGCTKMMHNAKEDAIFVQPFGRSHLDASKSTARDRRLATVDRALGIAFELAGDGAGQAL